MITSSLPYVTIIIKSISFVKPLHNHSIMHTQYTYYWETQRKLFFSVLPTKKCERIAKRDTQQINGAKKRLTKIVFSSDIIKTKLRTKDIRRHIRAYCDASLLGLSIICEQNMFTFGCVVWQFAKKMRNMSYIPQINIKP